MLPKYQVSELFARNRDQPTGESILDAVIEILRATSILEAQDIAHRLNVNPRYLSHAIELLTGKSLATMIREWRLLQAMHLIKTTDLPFMTIAHRCGYANADNLAKVMQKRLKMTPSEYRYN